MTLYLWAALLALIVAVGLPGCGYSSRPVAHMDRFDLSTSLPPSWSAGSVCEKQIRVGLKLPEIVPAITGAGAETRTFMKSELLADLAACGFQITDSGADYMLTLRLVSWQRAETLSKSSTASVVGSSTTVREGELTMDLTVARPGRGGTPASIVKRAVLSDSETVRFTPLPGSDRESVRSTEGDAIRALCRELATSFKTLACP